MYAKTKLLFFMLTACIISSCLFCCEASAERRPFVITQVLHGPLADAGKKILEEAYSRLEIPVVFKHVPGERALIMTNNGETDAEMFRIENMQKWYPNLIHIPVAYIVGKNVVFSRDTDFQVSGWESLRPYIIASRRGLKQAELNTRGMKRYLSDGSEAAFKMLSGGRVQIVIEEYLTGLNDIRLMNLKGIKVLNPPLAVNPLYHYLNKKHSLVAQKLTKVFQEMKDTGRFQEIYDDAVRELTQKNSALQEYEK